MRDEKEGIWIVGSINQGDLSFSNNPRQHGREAAEIEATRLARLNPGKTYVVAKIEKKVTADLVKWESM